MQRKTLWHCFLPSMQRARLRRWILPFNRELTLGALAQAPLLPWRWKMDLTHAWLKRHFYAPAGIVYMMPGGGDKAHPHDNDYAGALSLHPARGLPSTTTQCRRCVCMRVSDDCTAHQPGGHHMCGVSNNAVWNPD